MALLSIIALTPLIVTGLVVLRQFRVAYRAKVLDHVEAMTRRHSQTVDSFLSDRLSDIRIIAREHPIERLKEAEFLRRVLNLLREEYHGAFVDLGLVTAEGLQIAYAGPFNLTMADYAAAEWFQRARGQEHYISDVFAGLRGAPHFIVAAQRQERGETYLIKVTIDFEAFNALVGNIRIGRTGFAFIFNREGEFQTKPRFEVRLDSPPYSEYLRGTASQDRISIFEGADGLHRRSIFAFAQLKQGEWFLCFQQEAADAFAEYRATLDVVIVVFSIAVVATILLSFLVSRNLTQRLAVVDRRRVIMDQKVIEAGRLASIGELAAGIAHEINNPVAIMVEEAGWIDDLLKDAEPCSPDNIAEIARAAQQIRSQGDRCKQITYKLLSFARKTDPTVRQVDVNTLVEEVIGLLGQKARYANVRTVTDLSPGLPLVSASPSELQQVLLNLVNNAVDAIGQRGGTVSVSTRAEEDWVVLAVSDTGEGIPEANMARIFDPFFTTKPVGQGTGLGLSICYGIVDKLGGRIGVESEVGQGTTFTVYLSSGSGDKQPAERSATVSRLAGAAKGRAER